MDETMRRWREESGLNLFGRPEEDPLKKAVDLAANIGDLSLEELDSTIIVLASYHNYLSSQVGIIGARVEYLEEAFNTNLDSRSARYSAPSAAERRAIAISKNEDLSNISKTLRKERSKQLMMKPLLDSVRLKIDALKKIYERKGRVAANVA